MVRISKFQMIAPAIYAILFTALFFVLRELFAGRWLIDPIAFSLGPIDVRWYGIIIAIGILIALEWTSRRAERRGLDRRLVERVSWWAVLGGIVGARLIYVAQNLDYFSAHLDRVGALTDGGLSIHGALIGGALAVWLTIKRSGHSEHPSRRSGLGVEESGLVAHVDPSTLLGMTPKERFFAFTDAAVPGLLLAMILGRFGNLANAELFGPPTGVPWKLFIPVDARPIGLEHVAFYHPTFLYDALLNTLVLIGLLWLERRWLRAPGYPRQGGVEGNAPGRLTLWFFLGIAMTRFTVEFWRLGDTVALGLSLAQWVSLLIAGSCVVLLMFGRYSMDGRTFSSTPPGRVDPCLPAGRPKMRRS